MHHRRNTDYPFTVQDLERLIEELIGIRRLYKSTTVWKLCNVKRKFESLMKNFEEARENESMDGMYNGFELTDDEYEKIFDDFDFGMIDKNKTLERINYIKQQKVEEESIHERDIEYHDDSTDNDENFNEPIEKDCSESIEESIHEEEEDGNSTCPNVGDIDQTVIKEPEWTDSDEEETIKEEDIKELMEEESNDVQTEPVKQSVEEGVNESAVPEASESYGSYLKLLDYFNNKYKNETT